ncbi:MAG: HAD-IC family P-type ATPase [Opitutaceae bacterium]|nr:HAD-IC family P-type ATPase [Opitutaceae bacterium]
MHAQIVHDGMERFYELKDRAVSPAGSAVFQPRDYAWLAEAVVAAEAGAGRTAELVLDVQGISCVGCVWLIERLFQRRAGAVRLDVNVTQGRLHWRWETGRFDAVACARELQTFGYIVGPAGEKPDAAGARGLRLRLGLCAAFAMNTMIFALPAYLGLERASEFYPAFEAVQAAFATAALLAGGSYFGGRALAALRHGMINLDVPIALGLAVGYLGSMYGWLSGQALLVYFDFVSVFSFLMLVGRWTQEAAIERNRLQLLSLSREPAQVLVESDTDQGASTKWQGTGGQVASDKTDAGRTERGRRKPEKNETGELGNQRGEASGRFDGGAGFTPASSEPAGMAGVKPAPPTEAAADRSDSPPSSIRSPVSAARSPVSSLKRGQIFRLRAGQVVPVAARLLDAAATVTTEWINGEPEPRELAAGQTIPAGATSVSLHELRLDALEDWADSALARLLASSGAQGFRHELAERIVRAYLVVILVLAVLGGAGWWLMIGDAQKALQVAIAVLVASCPCGIGVAFPLVEELAVAAMRRHGVFVRELSLFPRLRGIRKAIFDKTGTLTLETPVLANPEALTVLGSAERQRLWQLVQDNPHPTARAVQEALAWEMGNYGVRNAECAVSDDGNSEPVAESPGLQTRNSKPETRNLEQLEEVVGQGVRLRAPDGVWSLGRPGFGGAADRTDPTDLTDRTEPPRAADAEYAHDGRILARLHFAEAARSDARAEITALQREGREVFILSGDRVEKVTAMAAALGVPAANAFGGLTPEQKRDWVLAHDARDTLMLGDGANDSLAFDAAFARGTPVIHRGMLERKCDFYYLGRGLRGVRRLFAVAELRRRTIRRVFVFALCYNVGTVSLALAGLVNPLVAAVAMPVSSLLSLAIATTGMRRAWRE